MFFGSQKGLVAFLPGQVVGRERAVPVFLTDFRLFGEPVLPGSTPLEQPIWSTASLALASSSIVSFDFAALNYVDPARTRYRYRLEGLEEKWNETDSTRRSATYTTLQPGDYTFRVQARGARGDWSDSALKVRVPPPWYATWYFRLLFAALLLTALWLAYRLRVRPNVSSSRRAITGAAPSPCRLKTRGSGVRLASHSWRPPAVSNAIPASADGSEQSIDRTTAPADGAMPATT
jgi:hypothetical protein